MIVVLHNVVSTFNPENWEPTDLIGDRCDATFYANMEEVKQAIEDGTIDIDDNCVLVNNGQFFRLTYAQTPSYKLVPVK